MKFIDLDELEKKINQSKVKLMPQDVLDMITEMYKNINNVKRGQVNNPDYTHEYIKENLEYSPSTGKFKWIKTAKGRRVSGEVGQLTPNGYCRISLAGFYVLAHRLAWFYMNGVWPENNIDHIDGNRNNNAWDNLRAATPLYNLKNKKKHKNNTSGQTGVYYQKSTGRWAATISSNYKRVNLGTFDKLEDAIKARKDGEALYGYHENHGREE